MKRKFRLTRSMDIQRVRRTGRSYAHPILVLMVQHSDQPFTRVGVIAGKGVGKAVQRNRAKRLLREAFRMIYPSVLHGYDVLLIARKKLLDTKFSEIKEVINSLLSGADLLQTNDNH